MRQVIEVSEDAADYKGIVIENLIRYCDRYFVGNDGRHRYSPTGKNTIQFS